MKKQYSRIFFNYLGEYYKFLNFSTSRDNSFHLYEEADKGFKYYPLNKLKDGRIKIDINNPTKTQFLRNKFTFHTSGTLHSSDKKGNRFKDGLKGIAFKDIEDSNLILILGPKKINSLIKSKIPKNGTNFIIELLDDLRPFTLNFEVFRKSQRDSLKDIPVKINHGPYTIEWTNLQFGLRFYTQNVTGVSNWPAVSLVLKRVAN